MVAMSQKGSSVPLNWIGTPACLDRIGLPRMYVWIDTVRVPHMLQSVYVVVILIVPLESCRS